MYFLILQKLKDVDFWKKLLKKFIAITKKKTVYILNYFLPKVYNILFTSCLKSITDYSEKNWKEFVKN